MFQRILKYTNTLKKLNFYSKFIDYGFDAYIQTFQESFKNNNTYFTTNMQKTLTNLPQESKATLDSFVNLMLNLPLPSKNFLLRKEAFYSKEELQQINIEERFKKTSKQYYKMFNLQGFEKLEVNVFKYHIGLKQIPKYILKQAQNKIFIDGGTFWGDSALILNKYYNPKKIICFEPNSCNYKTLQTTITNNNLQNKIKIINAGLSNVNGVETLNYISNTQNHGASFLFKAKKSKGEKVKITTIDSYLQENNLSNVANNIGILKLDVEGWGLKAIQGAKNTIKKNKPIISCAVYHNPEELLEIKPYLEKLNPTYKFLLLPLSQSFILKELTLIAY